MSLRNFHIVFISLSILFSFAYASWALFFHPTDIHENYFWTGIFAFTVGLGLVIYGINFLKKCA